MSFILPTRQEFVPIRSKEEVIPAELLRPSYSDRRFSESAAGVTIFLAADAGLIKDEFGTDVVEGAFYNYSDRFDPNDYSSAIQAATQHHDTNNTAAFYETVLQTLYQDDSVQLQHMLAGVNDHSLFAFQVYGAISDVLPRAA